MHTGTQFHGYCGCKCPLHIYYRMELIYIVEFIMCYGKKKVPRRCFSLSFVLYLDP